jgi:hypothetical protein
VAASIDRAIAVTLTIGLVFLAGIVDGSEASPASPFTAAPPAPSAPRAEAGEPVRVPPPGIYGADPARRAAIESAIDRFRDAGIPLPPLRIYAHTSTDGCEGHSGMFMQYGDESRVDLCIAASGMGLALHELAHAWEHHRMADDARQAFLGETGLVWYDPDTPWRERGIEQVAITIAWGLLDQPLTDDQAAGNAELLGRFRLLTGVTSPRLPRSESHVRGGGATRLSEHERSR